MYPASSRQQSLCFVLALTSVLISASSGVAVATQWKIDQSAFVTVWCGFVLGGAVGFTSFVVLVNLFWRKALPALWHPFPVLMGAILFLCSCVVCAVILPANSRFHARFTLLTSLKNDEVRQLNICKTYSGNQKFFIKSRQAIEQFVERCRDVKPGGNPKELFYNMSAELRYWDVEVIFENGRRLTARFSYLVDAPSAVHGSFAENLVSGDFESKDQRFKDWFLEYVETR